jgi:putative peptidoglycan lipid II flippase
MTFTGVSRILGFLRQAVVNAVFGATGTADVLNAVFLVPNNLRKLMAEGALSSAYVPVISQAQADEQARAAGVPAEITRGLVGFQLLVLVPVLVLSVIFAGPITRTIFDFPELARQALAADLFQWLIHYTLLISISAVLMGALHAAGRFSVPAITPILFSVTVIASVFVFSDRYGIYSVAIGVLAGGFAQIAFQYPQFRREGFEIKPLFAFHSPQFLRIIRGWLPVVAASSIFAINQQIALYFASGLTDGSSSAIANATIFWQLPQGIFAISVTTVLFPRMSREAGAGDLTGLKKSVSRGIRDISALLVPSSILLAAFAPEVVAVAFQRGEFGAADTARTALVLIHYCIGMVGVSLYTFLQRFFYATGEFRPPILTAGVVLLINTIGSLLLKESLGPSGLALANGIAFTVGAIIQVGIARRRLKGLQTRAIIVTVVKAVAASVPGLAVVIAGKIAFPEWWVAGSTFMNLGLLMAIGGIALAGTGLLMVLLRIEIVDGIRRRIPRDSSSS